MKARTTSPLHTNHILALSMLLGTLSLCKVSPLINALIKRASALFRHPHSKWLAGVRGDELIGAPAGTTLAGH